MHRIKLSIILFLLVLQSKPLTAQFDNVHFERTSIKHGLPNGYIREIFEDILVKLEKANGFLLTQKPESEED